MLCMCAFLLWTIQKQIVRDLIKRSRNAVDRRPFQILQPNAQMASLSVATVATEVTLAASRDLRS